MVLPGYLRQHSRCPIQFFAVFVVFLFRSPFSIASFSLPAIADCLSWAQRAANRNRGLPILAPNGSDCGVAFDPHEKHVSLSLEVAVLETASERASEREREREREREH